MSRLETSGWLVGWIPFRRNPPHRHTEVASNAERGDLTAIFQQRELLGPHASIGAHNRHVVADNEMPLPSGMRIPREPPDVPHCDCTLEPADVLLPPPALGGDDTPLTMNGNVWHLRELGDSADKSKPSV
jgi:hypothetical protein